MKANKLTVALALFLSAAAAGQSTGADWKEYAYAADNFALSAPYRPDPHADAAFENATA